MTSREYPHEAKELCRKLYCQYGGNPAQIEREMKKQYPGWTRRLLNDRGTGPDSRHGWITKYGFEKSLELHQQNQIASVVNDDERRYQAVVKLADHYQEKALQGDEKAVQLFIKLTEQQIELRNKLDLTTGNFETFVEDFELIVKWAKEIDTDLAKLFYKRKDEFIEMAEVHFGKSEIG
ncbi:MAG: hypothetical protein JSS81_05895 [Acidobacteria bacterium]|nr:hypothetical protein [Acidobacteriota bacterium]